jgi:hypothetical protein
MSLEELSLHDFLIEQIWLLQLVVEAQVDAPSLSQEPPQPKINDECLKLEVQLHISFKMISQLVKAEESRWLSPEELSLHDFLAEQIRSLQLVVEEQGVAPSLIQASFPSAQNPCRCFLHRQDTEWSRSRVPILRWSCELQSILWFIRV